MATSTVFDLKLKLFLEEVVARKAAKTQRKRLFNLTGIFTLIFPSPIRGESYLAPGWSEAASGG